MEAHPDALVLFAAGNDGDSDPPDGTVGSPATCKNCLAVGASQARPPLPHSTHPHPHPATPESHAHPARPTASGPAYHCSRASLPPPVSAGPARAPPADAASRRPALICPATCSSHPSRPSKSAIRVIRVGHPSRTSESAARDSLLCVASPDRRAPRPSPAGRRVRVGCGRGPGGWVRQGDERDAVASGGSLHVLASNASATLDMPVPLQPPALPR